MRISDWSSDVCSSDLGRRHARGQQFGDAQVLVADRALDVGPLGIGGVFRGIERVEGNVAGTAAGPDQERRLDRAVRSEEHTSALQSLLRISYAVFCLKKKTNQPNKHP